VQVLPFLDGLPTYHELLISRTLLCSAGTVQRYTKKYSDISVCRCEQRISDGRHGARKTSWQAHTCTVRVADTSVLCRDDQGCEARSSQAPFSDLCQ